MAIPFPILTSKRLYLREIHQSDIERICYFRSDKEINKFIKRAEPQTLDTAIAHIQKINSAYKKNQSVAWGIRLQEAPLLIGSICLWNFSEDRKTAEVGYDMDPEFQGKGFMTEALLAVVNFGFETMNFKTIEAFTDNSNVPSRKLLEKNGFSLEVDKKDDDNADNVVYCLHR